MGTGTGPGTNGADEGGSPGSSWMEGNSSWAGHRESAGSSSSAGANESSSAGATDGIKGIMAGCCWTGGLMQKKETKIERDDEASGQKDPEGLTQDCSTDTLLEVSSRRLVGDNKDRCCSSSWAAVEELRRPEGILDTTD